MRTIILIYNYSIGGAQRSLIRTANNIFESGRDVLVVSFSGQGELRSQLNSEIPTHELGSQRVSRSLHRLYALLKHHKQVNLITSLVAPSVAAILISFLVPGTRVYIREASAPSQELRRNIKDRIIHLFAGLLYRHTERMIAVSEGVRADLISYYGIIPDKISVVYNPVASSNSNSELRGGVPWSTLPSPLSLGFVGRIDPVKRIEIQIKVIALLKDAGVNASLKLAGPQNNKQYFEELQSLVTDYQLHDSIDFLGPVSNSSEMFDCVDIILLSSLYEGLPSVLIEALIAGKKIIACDCNHGPREVLDYGKYGVLIPQENCAPEAIYKAIINNEFPTYPTNVLSEHLRIFSKRRNAAALDSILGD